MIIPLPHGLAFEDWSNFLVEAYAEEGMPEWRPLESEWKDWAERIAEVDALDVPDPEGFGTWQAWAERVVGIVFD